MRAVLMKRVPFAVAIPRVRRKLASFSRVLPQLSRVAAISIVLLITAALVVPTAAAQGSSNDSGVTTDISVKVERDGSLSVREKVTVPPGEPVRRSVELRQGAGDLGERVFTVNDAHVQGAGSVHADPAVLTVEIPPGESTLSYSVVGAVANTGQGQEVRWQVTGGWSRPVQRATLSAFVTPQVPTSIDCLAGPVGSSSRCDLFEIGHTNSVRAESSDVPAGQRMDVAVTLPPGSVPANARFEESFSFGEAFSLTPASGAGLVGVGLLLIGGFGVLWYFRGRDARALAGDVGPVDVVMTDSAGNAAFASPDGVLPGQVGAVLDEYVDVTDVTATTIDLAVRNYLWIEEIPGQRQAWDWRIVRLNPPDESLRPYELAVYEMFLGTEHGPEGVQEVLLSRLRGATLELSRVREELYDDVVDKSWFARRPDAERNLFWWTGVGIVVAGVALTTVLALTSTLALLGVALVLGGIAATFAARLMPARTRRGSMLMMQMRGMREYLRSARAADIADSDREMVFSRSLPYAIVLGESQHWLAEFADLDPGADGVPGLYWYGEFVEDTGHVAADLQRFQAHFPMLLAAMREMLAQGRQVRSSH